MKTCPHCKTPVPGEQAACPRCGRGLPSGAPPGLSRGGLPSDDSGLSWPEIPDIEPLRPLKVEPGFLSGGGPSESGGQPLENDGPAPALDMDPRRPSRAPVSLSPWQGEGLEEEDRSTPIALETEPLPLSRPGTVASGAPPPSSFRGMPPLGALFRARPVVDPVEVLVLADFGPAPRGWMDAVPYALRVRRRKRELAVEVARQRKLLADHERANDYALSRVVESLRDRISPGHPAYPHFQNLRPVDELASVRDAALDASSKEYAAEAGRIDASIAEREAERAKSEAAVEAARSMVDERIEEKARAAAKHKRSEIALRAAHEAARVAAGPDAKFAPPEHARRIRGLQAERDALALALQPVVAAADEATAERRRLEANAREARRQIAKLREERRGLERVASRQLEARSAGVDEAERERVRSYAAAARVLLHIAAAEIPEEDRDALADAQRLVDERTLDIEKHLFAIDSADTEAENRGRRVIAAGVVLCLILLVLTVRTGTR